MNTYMPAEHWHDDEICDMIIFEHFNGDLEEVMAERTKSGQIFKEEELWNLADSCICALAKMQYYKIPHRNVGPEQVLRCGVNYKIRKFIENPW